jgi:hypothetical protein
MNPPPPESKRPGSDLIAIQLSAKAALSYYKNRGLEPIPLERSTKKPLFRWKDKAAVANATFGEDDNIALICEGGLVVQDFESQVDFRAFYTRHEKLVNETLVVSTPHGGVHVYWMDREPARRVVRIFGDEHPVDFCGKGGYVVAPPSVIDHAHCGRSKCPRTGVDAYRVISSSWQIKTARNVFASTVARGKALGWKPKVSEREVAAWSSRGISLPNGIEKSIFGKVTEDPPCVKNLMEGVSEGRRDWAAFLLGNYLASWRGIDTTTVVEMLVEWNKHQERMGAATESPCNKALDR